ncbi:MAG TPA: asparagine synthetase B, partial [Enteractinococcus sp.]
GTGMNEVLRAHFEHEVTEAELQQEALAVEPPLNSREELAYYRIFTETFPGLDADRVVGRSIET